MGNYITLNPQVICYYMSELHAICGNAQYSAPHRGAVSLPYCSYGYVYGTHICASRICRTLQPFVTQTTCGFKDIEKNDFLILLFIKLS